MSPNPVDDSSAAATIADLADKLSDAFRHLAAPAAARDYAESLATGDLPRLDKILDPFRDLPTLLGTPGLKFWIPDFEVMEIRIRQSEQVWIIRPPDKREADDGIMIANCRLKFGRAASTTSEEVWEDPDLRISLGQQTIVGPGPYFDCLTYNKLVDQAYRADHQIIVVERPTGSGFELSWPVVFPQLSPKVPPFD